MLHVVCIMNSNAKQHNLKLHKKKDVKEVRFVILQHAFDVNRMKLAIDFINRKKG